MIGKKYEYNIRKWKILRANLIHNININASMHNINEDLRSNKTPDASARVTWYLQNYWLWCSNKNIHWDKNQGIEINGCYSNHISLESSIDRDNCGKSTEENVTYAYAQQMSKCGWKTIEEEKSITLYFRLTLNISENNTEKLDDLFIISLNPELFKSPHNTVWYKRETSKNVNSLWNVCKSFK